MTIDAPQATHNYELWKHLSDEHGLILLESELSEIITLSEKLSPELDQLRKQNAALREALTRLQRCGVCNGTGKWVPECQACLAGEPNYCTCNKEEPEVCSCCNGTGNQLYEDAGVTAALQPDAGARYLSPEQHERVLELLREEHDKEVGEFQNDVRELVIKLSGAPDESIDGKGSDAGWQEFTLTEISQGFGWLKDHTLSPEQVKPDDRIMELAQRLVASGPKAAHVSASEIHEVVNWIFELEELCK